MTRILWLGGLLCLCCGIAALLGACGGSALLPQGALPTSTPTAQPSAEQVNNVLARMPIAALPDEVAGLPRQALDLDIWPRDLYGQAYAGIEGSQIDLVDLATGNETRLSPGPAREGEVVLSEVYVAWTVQAGERTVGEGQRVPIYQIMVQDRRTGKVTQITQEAMPRMGLAIDGQRLVWMDKRNELEAPYTDYDLYAYDLAAKVEIPIAVAPGAQQSPSIYGDRVVWADNRNSPQLGTPGSGCGNCPENRFDIYLYDLSTQTERAVVEDEWLKSRPSVYGRWIAWMAWHEPRYADLYLMDLESGARYQITETADPTVGPVLTGDRLLWTVTSSCDVISRGPDGKEILPQVGVYVLDLRTGEVLRLTDDKESSALIDGDTVVITESCFSIEDVYAVSLD